MIRMLPIVDALRQTSHMAGRRKELEEADLNEDDRGAQKVAQFAWNVQDSLQDTRHLMDRLKQESRGVHDSRIQGLIRNAERHIGAVETAIKQIAK